MYATTKDVKARTQLRTQKEKRTEFMTGMIAPRTQSCRRCKLDEAQTRGFDLPNEVECALAVWGKYGEGCVDGSRKT